MAFEFETESRNIDETRREYIFIVVMFLQSSIILSLSKKEGGGGRTQQTTKKLAVPCYLLSLHPHCEDGRKRKQPVSIQKTLCSSFILYLPVFHIAVQRNTSVMAPVV